MRPLRLTLTLLLSAWSIMTSSWALEIAEPASRAQELPAPRFVEDPARPPEAPAFDALEGVSAEGGIDAAVRLADKALAASRAAYGAQDARVAVPTINLALARQRAGDTVGAQRDYQAAIGLLEAHGGPRDDRLFDAWYGIGHAHYQAAHYAAAAAAFETALQLHRINRGLYSVEQLDVLQSVAMAQRARGDVEEADQTQVRRMAVAERVHGLGTPQLADVYVSGGRWFRSVGRPFESLRLNALAIQIYEKQSKEDSRLLEPLVQAALAGSERRRDPDEPQLVGVPSPGVALSRAERLADARTKASPAERAADLIRIGDAHLVMGRREAALKVYAKATGLLVSVGARPPFDEPVFISFQAPRPEPLDGPGGFALAEFTVDRNGKTRDVRIVQQQPAILPGVVTQALSRAIRDARLRPRVVDGQAVETVGVRYRLPVRGGSGQ